MADSLGYEAVYGGIEAAPLPAKGEFWILGKLYILPRDKNAMKEDVESRLWCSYRKNFRTISGTSLSSDAGWGCTLRCGQMLLAQTLLIKHLGREWRWELKEDNPVYMKILRKFLDSRDSEYSLQMIALQGADFGRPVGHWFGPNNVAQTIKKLSVHDSLSKLAVCVAMDMLVVIEDLKSLCREPHKIPGHIKVTNEEGQSITDVKSARNRSLTDISHLRTADSKTQPTTSSPYSTAQTRKHSSSCATTDTICERTELSSSASSTSSSSTDQDEQTETNYNSPHSTGKIGAGDNTVKGLRQRSIKEMFSDVTNVKTPDKSSRPTSHIVIDDKSSDYMRLSIRETPGDSESILKRGASAPVGCGYSEDSYSSDDTCDDDGGARHEKFRSLLLFIPLRLGQDSFNMEYSRSLKACLELPQSVGFIGGKPRHALYFIGYHEDKLLYLDPHTTQQTVTVKDPKHIPDQSYHCSQPDSMFISELDPSVALGFFCKDENDLDNLCQTLKEKVLCNATYNMFELTDRRPCYWDPSSEAALNYSVREPFMLVDGANYPDGGSDDDDFEIITWPPTTPTSQGNWVGQTPPSSHEKLVGQTPPTVHHEEESLLAGLGRLKSNVAQLLNN